MSFNLRNSLTTIYLISLILVINLIVALAANRETIKRNTDEQDDEWITKQRSGADLIFNSGLDNDLGLDKFYTLVPRFRGVGRFSPSSSSSSPSGPTRDILSPEKRQIRYHQCYFNPISCFRRRK
ncbi:uncharacterized protein LOC128392802 [Panonychus citri]|uniref:uncharacterized protein LOC128392802 n=1 Tax=Panonychus citri TaxID=50023 RepID=UPI0023071524|nr:uncharacterized protein LOC128392802 [Panonychus citri]